MATSDYTPTVSEVAAYLRTRTKSKFQDEGEFNDETRPTAGEVESLIEEAVQEVATSIGELDSELPCAMNLRSRAKGAVTLYACILIEASYFPEQVGTRSTAEFFEGLYDRRMKSLKDAVTDCLGGSGEAVGGGSAGAVHSFPCAEIIGRETEW